MGRLYLGPDPIYDESVDVESGEPRNFRAGAGKRPYIGCKTNPWLESFKKKSALDQINEGWKVTTIKQNKQILKAGKKVFK